jgi:hypothetical protein
MLLRLYKGTGPGVIFLIVITAAGVWTGAFIAPQLPSLFNYDVSPMPLYALLLRVIGGNTTIGIIFSFVLVLLMAFLLVNFNTTVFFINQRTFLPAVVYVLFTGLFPQYQLLNPALPASLFLMLAIRRVIDSYRKNDIAFNFFDASFLIGTGTLFYFNLIWFWLLIILGIAIFRTWNIWEALLSILGLCTPLLLTAAVYYVSGMDPGQLITITRYNLLHVSGDYTYSRVAITELIFIAIIILISLFHLLSVMNIKKIKSRKTFSELIGTFLACVLVFYILPSVSVELIFIATIPISYFLTHYFVFTKKQLIPEIFFTVFFLIIIVQQIMHFK